jgi:hypothetical protein
MPIKEGPTVIRRRWKDWTPRQRGLLVLVGVMLTGSCAVTWWVRPWYDQWRQLQSETQTKAAQLDHLWHNLSIRAAVDAEFEKLPPAVSTAEPDEMAESRFLRELETLGRLPTLTLVNMKPLAVQTTGTHKVYPVHLTASGDLKDVVTFVASVVNRQEPTGLREFTLRAGQGPNVVECSITFWTVRLNSRAPAKTTVRSINAQ